MANAFRNTVNLVMRFGFAYVGARAVVKISPEESGSFKHSIVETLAAADGEKTAHCWVI